jgi:hypothetical protein
MANIKISELNPSGDNVSADNSDLLHKLDDVIVQNIMGGSFGGCKNYLKKCYGQKNLGFGNGYGGYGGYGIL